jgi:hypothetical protein
MTDYALPDNHVLRRHVFCFSDSNLAVYARSVQRRRDLDDDIACRKFRLEHGFDVDGVLDARLADLFDDGLDTEGEVDVGGRPVAVETSKVSLDGKGKGKRVGTGRTA